MGRVKEQRAEHGPTPESLAVEQLLSEWRYFDNGGRTMDRYSCWQGPIEGDRRGYHSWLDMSDDPFHPQGVGMHNEGLDPESLFTREDDDWTAEMEVKFDSLPEKVQKCIRQDAIEIVKWQAEHGE